MTCPRCHAELTPAEIRSLQQQLNNSRIRKRSGGKVWRKHIPQYSRCRCAKCNLARQIKAGFDRDRAAKSDSFS